MAERSLQFEIRDYGEKNHETPLRLKHGLRMITAISESTRLAIEAATAPLIKRIAELEGSVPAYRGTFQHDRQYERNSIITHHGAMWIALLPTKAAPPSADWQLCCKAGRDGKDAR